MYVCVCIYIYVDREGGREGESEGRREGCISLIYIPRDVHCAAQQHSNVVRMPWLLGRCAALHFKCTRSLMRT